MSNIHEDLIKKIYDEHINLFENKDIHLPSLVVSFSAIPGMGKTTLAKKIAQKFKGEIYENDSIRKILRKIDGGKNSVEDNEKIYAYFAYLCKRVVEDRNNKFMIMDSSCDRTYPIVKNWCDKRGIPFLVIRLTVAKDEAMKRLEQRDSGKLFEVHRQQIENGLRDDYVAFGQKNIHDVEYKGEVDDEEVFKLIEKYIK